MDTIGVIFCHGHIHKLLPSYLSDLASRWILVDIHADTNPDIADDIYENSTLNEIRSFAQGSPIKVVISYYCPIIGDVSEYTSLTKLLIQGQRLLTFGGSFILLAGLRILAARYAFWMNYRNSELIPIGNSRTHTPGNFRSSESFDFVKDEFIYRAHEEDPETLSYLGNVLNMLTVNSGFENWSLSLMSKDIIIFNT